MLSLFKSLLILHIAGGTAGLISGTIAASAKKGSKLHKISGVIFFWGMLIASLDALVLSNLPEHHNLFLFAVGGFTLYMISSGYRIVYVKRKLKQPIHSFTLLDYAIPVFGLLFGLFLLIMGALTMREGSSFGIVPIVFGLISINFARKDFILLSGKESVKASWMRNHIIRMMGAMIASYTAFLVVNVKFQPNWVLWLAPTLLGSVLITYFVRKYTTHKKKQTD